jgi:hypothetical protein
MVVVGSEITVGRRQLESFNPLGNSILRHLAGEISPSRKQKLDGLCLIILLGRDRPPGGPVNEKRMNPLMRGFR